MNIGLFFGSFNPVHLGHVKLVTKILNEDIFDQLWIVLSPKSPHKTQDLVKKNFRLKMLELAFNKFKNVVVSDVEFKLSEPNFTFNTLSYLTTKFPSYKFSIIMGSDNLQNFHTWKNYKIINKNFFIYVYPRGKFEINNKSIYKNVIYLDLPKFNISATGIRKNFSINNQEVKKNLPSEVYSYILKNRIY
jgi:nicotinate-nucleotide adenylyltransferase